MTDSPLSARMRYEVLRRDGYTCRYCGAKAPDVELHVDHVVPIALGGGNEPANLVAACADCNRGKTSTSPDEPIVEGVADSALRWANAMQLAAEIQARDRTAMREYCEKFRDAWDHHYALPHDWETSLEHWFKLGIEIELVIDCAWKAIDARGVDWRWKYFCGIVWRRINERQQIARDLFAGEVDGE